MKRREQSHRLNSVSTRFNYALAAVATLALLAFAAVLIVSDFRTASRELEERTRVVTKLAVESLEIPMWNLDYQTVSNIVSAFLEDEDIASMVVVEGDEQIASMTQPTFAGSDFASFDESPDFFVGHEDIRHNDRVIGEVRLALSRERVRSELTTNVMLVLGVSALILVAILTTSRLITRRFITRRLLELEHAATAIAGGDLEADIRAESDDEIGRLEQNLGTMRDAIKRLVEDLHTSNKQLEQHNVMLGERVRERTAEFEQAMNAAQKAQRLAEGANRAKSDFLSNMSHELRTPLNAIIGFTEYVIENEDEPITRDQKASLSQVLRAGRHLLVLINDVLDLSKIEAGAISLSPEPVDAVEVINECLTLTSSTAAGRNVEVVNQLSVRDSPLIDADRIRFKQVFLNILTNAIKYNKEPGRVDILQGSSTPGMFRIGVRDEGAGIAKDRLAKLFDPFDRLGAENSAIEGTGIGLTITKRLVDQMDGKISVDSVVGEGSTFWLEMPISDKAAAHPAAVNEVDTGFATDVEGLILYVEDNPANLELVRRIMSLQPGVDFIAAPTGESGLDRARTEVPDVILLDINLPGLDGFQVLEALSRMPETRHIPVIALTAAATEADIARGEAAGFFSYLTKPIAARDLMATIRRALRPVEPAATEPTTIAPRNKVLVVDDLPINLTITRKQLTKLGIPCDTVESPVEALEMLKSGAYAMALVDIGMPVLNGIELTRRLRAAERESKSYTPVVALTASYGSEEDIARYRTAGMDGQLTKPVILKELASTLRRWLSEANGKERRDCSDTSQVVPEAADAREPIDVNEFKEIIGTDDKEMIREMFDIFVDLIPGELDNLASAAVSEDTARLREAAHRFKSGAKNTAARRLSNLLENIESRADSGDWDMLNDAVATVREECQKVVQYMRTVI